MANELYFMPIIERALKQPDAKSALVEAFKEIERLGSDPSYRVGYANFKRFMRAAARADMWDSDSESVGGPDMPPEWLEEFEQCCSELEPLEGPGDYPVIVIEQEDRPVGRIVFQKIPDSGAVDGIVPGMYCVRFDSGQVLWEGELAAKDVLWAIAFPGEGLKMAADTTAGSGRASREISLLGGEIVLRVYPGPECGRMEIEICHTGDC